MGIPIIMGGPPAKADPLSKGTLELRMVPGMDPIERRREVRLMDVRAKGPMVELIQEDKRFHKRFSVLITRRDALKRAEAISGLNENSLELQTALIRAVREAYKNETGLEYQSVSLKMLDVEERQSAKTGRTTW